MCDVNYAYHLDLTAILASGHDDVWIGGGPYRRPEECPLPYHWDGKSLREVWVATTSRDVASLEQAIDYQPDDPDAGYNYAAFPGMRSWWWALATGDVASALFDNRGIPEARCPLL